MLQNKVTKEHKVGAIHCKILPNKLLQFCNKLQIFFQCRFVAVKNVVNETLQGLVDDTKRFVLCVNWRSSFWKSHCLKSQLVGFYENVRTLHKMLFVIFFRYHEFFLREFSIEFSWIISKTAVHKYSGKYL